VAKEHGEKGHILAGCSVLFVPFTKEIFVFSSKSNAFKLVHQLWPFRPKSHRFCVSILETGLPGQKRGQIWPLVVSKRPNPEKLFSGLIIWCQNILY